MGARVEQVKGARFEGGAVYVDVIIDHSGERRLHPVKLVARPAPPPVKSGPGLLGVVGAAVLAGGFGLLAGVAVCYVIAAG